MWKQNERQENQTANHGTVEQYRDDGVANNCLLFEDVVKAQKEGWNQW